jgi:hypothetical protein
MITTCIDSDRAYAEFSDVLSTTFSNAVGPFFTTDAEGLFELFLRYIPEDQRQHYTCNCCRRFVETYGGLVTIHGEHLRPLWPTKVPDFFLSACRAIEYRVMLSKVTGVFYSGEDCWGVASNVAGIGSKYVGTRFYHMHANNPSVFATPLQTDAQAQAEKRQDYILLKRTLSIVPKEAVVQAIRVLDADVVDRSEKHIDNARWLLGLYGVHTNALWKAVATAPAGWAHARSGMLSTLFDDIIAGLPFEEIKRKWDAKMHPLKYRRPVAPPSDGQIESANKLMEKLNAAGALDRRYARLDEVQVLWQPKDAVPAAPGRPFDKLKSKLIVKPVQLPAKRIEWREFLSILLGEAKLEVRLRGIMPFYGLVTAVNADSPPMLQWDAEPARNPVSWYHYAYGSSSEQWGLADGWHEVSAVMLQPHLWQRPDQFRHMGEGVFFAITGAKDANTSCGGGYFPETLRAEFHGIRSVIEAHSRASTFAGREEGNANGVALSKNNALAFRINGAEYIVSL